MQLEIRDFHDKIYGKVETQKPDWNERLPVDKSSERNSSEVQIEWESLRDWLSWLLSTQAEDSAW